MNNFGLVRLFGFAVAFSFASFQIAAPAASKPVRYTLLSDSQFIKDCLICAIPTMFFPLRGTFDLIETDVGPQFTTYRIENVSFRAGFGTNSDYVITGSGTYRLGGQLAVFQEMVLNVTVNGKPMVLTNEDRIASRQFPLIKAFLDETQPEPANFYRIDLFAAPVREVWFSLQRRAMVRSRMVEPWDILSMDGRVVKDYRLQSNLGIPIRDREPSGVDALDVVPGGDVWFSLSENDFSDTLGELHEGDILSESGRIVRHNQDLTRPFAPLLPDVGLDSLAVRDNGEILFSVRSNFFSPRLATTIKRGDLLSDRGQIVFLNEQLLSAFHPTVQKDYGLDAVHVWPNGEVWFSTEEGFVDGQLGTIQEGDLLSNLGYVAFRNVDLLAAFAPVDSTVDYGLDALFIVTDTISPAAQPRLAPVDVNRSSGDITLQWQGPGRVFQVEKAGVVTGPYLPLSPIQTESEYLDKGAAKNSSTGFYRLRQW